MYAHTKYFTIQNIFSIPPKYIPPHLQILHIFGWPRFPMTPMFLVSHTLGTRQRCMFLFFSLFLSFLPGCMCLRFIFYSYMLACLGFWVGWGGGGDVTTSWKLQTFLCRCSLHVSCQVVNFLLLTLAISHFTFYQCSCLPVACACVSSSICLLVWGFG